MTIFLKFGWCHGGAVFGGDGKNNKISIVEQLEEWSTKASGCYWELEKVMTTFIL